MKNPLWIVFEGLDGSGKTTQAKMLSDYLNDNGVKCLYKHVFDSKTGTILRDIFINNSLSNTLEILILCAARQALFDEISENEQKYDVIVIDRLFLSILSMQGNSEADTKLIRYIQKIICKEKQDFLIFYMDTFPSECRKRLNNKKFCDRIEEKNIEFHEVVYNRFSQLLRCEKNAYIINGNDDIESIYIQIFVI